MYILDTDHISLIQRGGQEGQRISARVATHESAGMIVTIITYEEQIRGWLNLVSRAKTPDARIYAYEGIQQLIVSYRSIIVLPFTRTAFLEYERLRKAYPRLGNMDLKIAAIAIIYEATLATRNQSDFSEVTGLFTIDWSRE